MIKGTKQFNGDRLREARTMRAMTITELADATEVSKQAISLYENGKNVPEYDKVMKMARALGFPFEHFFTEGKLQTETKTTYFRSLASTSKKDRKAQILKLEYVARLFDVLCNYLEFPKYVDPQVNYKGYDKQLDFTTEEARLEIEAAAQRVREAWDIPDGPIEDLQYVLESHGVIVTAIDPEADSIDAFSQRTTVDGEEVYLVVVTQGTRSECRIRLDMAHELGHIILHPWSDDIEELSREEFKLREGQANMFASALLLPEKEFSEDVRQYPTDLNYYIFLKKKWKVSIQAMIVRAFQLGFITGNQYQYMMRQVSKRGWRKNEPGDIIYRLEESLFQGAIDMLFEYSDMDAGMLMDEFRSYEINLYADMIEELLLLKPGTLNRPKDNIIPFIRVKNNETEEGD